MLLILLVTLSLLIVGGMVFIGCITIISFLFAYESRARCLDEIVNFGLSRSKKKRQEH